MARRLRDSFERIDIISSTELTPTNSSSRTRSHRSHASRDHDISETNSTEPFFPPKTSNDDLNHPWILCYQNEAPDDVDSIYLDETIDSGSLPRLSARHSNVASSSFIEVRALPPASQRVSSGRPPAGAQSRQPGVGMQKASAHNGVYKAQPLRNGKPIRSGAPRLQKTTFDSPSKMESSDDSTTTSKAPFDKLDSLDSQLLTDPEFQKAREKARKKIRRLVTFVAVTLMLMCLVLIGVSLSLGSKIDDMVTAELEDARSRLSARQGEAKGNGTSYTT